jgi:hypothetical protein
VKALNFVVISSIANHDLLLSQPFSPVGFGFVSSTYVAPAIKNLTSAKLSPPYSA